MRLIDADRLLQHTKFYNLKNGNRAIDEIDILHAPTVQAIPLDKIRQARDEIYNLVETDPFTSKTQIEIEFNTKVLAILDELIESEG